MNKAFSNKENRESMACSRLLVKMSKSLKATSKNPRFIIERNRTLGEVIDSRLALKKTSLIKFSNCCSSCVFTAITHSFIFKDNTFRIRL